jgi:hypothetical protein
MNKILLMLSILGKYIVFHRLSLATIITGIVMLLTSHELGPAQGFFVPLGLYAIIMGVCVELLFGLGFIISVCAQYIQNRCNKSGANK